MSYSGVVNKVPGLYFTDACCPYLTQNLSSIVKNYDGVDNIAQSRSIVPYIGAKELPNNVVKCVYTLNVSCYLSIIKKNNLTHDKGCFHSFVLLHSDGYEYSRIFLYVRNNLLYYVLVHYLTSVYFCLKQEVRF